MEAKNLIETGKSILGIEFGSTRIKAVLVDEKETRSHPEAMNGKMNFWTVSGPTQRRQYGTVLLTAMPI